MIILVLLFLLSSPFDSMFFVAVLRARLKNRDVECCIYTLYHSHINIPWYHIDAQSSAGDVHACRAL